MFAVVSNEVWNVCFSYIILHTSAVVRWSWERINYALYGPVKGLLTAGGLVKGLLNGIGKGLLATDGLGKGL